jgi:hypothetical protein
VVAVGLRQSLGASDRLPVVAVGLRQSLGASGRLPRVRGMSPVSCSAGAGVAAWAAVVASVLVATSARLRPPHFQVKMSLLGFHENEGLLKLGVQGREVEWVKILNFPLGPQRGQC